MIIRLTSHNEKKITKIYQKNNNRRMVL